MTKDDGRFEHPSNAEILTPDDVNKASEMVTSRAGDKPEAQPWETWSSGKKADK